jgi:prenyltransferase beta subunit
MSVAAFALTASVGLAPSASADGASSPERQPLLDSTVRFLQESQQPNGGFAQAGEPSQGTSAWVTFALAAAGINPQDQALPCGTDAYDYLTGHFREGFEEEIPWPRIATTAFERELLVVDTAGTDPHSFAGFDLVAEILARVLPDGSFPYVLGGRGEVNDTAFAILALSPVGEPAARDAVREAAEWLIAQQNADGGWSYGVKGDPSEVDMTGAAVEALGAAGGVGAEAQREAFAYLKAAQLPDGGFPARPDSERESNVASTAWAVQGLWAAGENPEAWLTGSGEETEEPLDYMESMQEPDGHIRWRKSSDMNGIWMTAYVAPAFAGQALPPPTVPRSLAAAPACEAAGQGGESPHGDSTGVLAGGGGRRAPLFSRPKPQSQGKTPGGVRQIRRVRRAADHSRTRRGENAEQPTATATSEPVRKRAEAPPASRAGSGGGGGEPSSGGEGGGDAGAGEVTGTLVGGGLAGFGAPGLHGAGAGSGGAPWTAPAIVAAALLCGFGGAQLERRRGEALP